MLMMLFGFGRIIRSFFRYDDGLIGGYLGRCSWLSHGARGWIFAFGLLRVSSELGGMDGAIKRHSTADKLTKRSSW